MTLSNQQTNNHMIC